MILPTRDGNLIPSVQTLFIEGGFDPTYKGWKPVEAGVGEEDREVL